MKKTVVILTLFVVVSMLLVGWCFDRPSTELYAKSGVVTLIDRTENRVVFTDHQGEVWEFESEDDWEVDDLVTCVMSDNGTDEIYDDEVVSVRYEG